MTDIVVIDASKCHSSRHVLGIDECPRWHEHCWRQCHLFDILIVHVGRFKPDRTNRIGSLTLSTRSCVSVSAQELYEELYEEARSVLDHQCSVRSRRRSPRGGR